MKKIASAAACAALLSGGLVAATSAPSVAAPYSGTVDTNCQGEAVNSPRAGNDAIVRFRVTTAGNGEARGKVTFTYQRKRSGVIEGDFTWRYDGTGWEKYANRNLPKGRYNVEVFFNSTPSDSVYKDCRTTFSQRVRAAR